MGCTQSQKPKEKDNFYKKSSSSNGNIKHDQNVRDETFSPQHKDMLRATWKTISLNRQERGIQIFVQIFHERPDLQRLFPFKDCNGEDLLNNTLFRSHALRFINAVDTTVQSLDALDVALIPVLHHLGKQHLPIHGFLPEYLPIFMRAIMTVFERVLGSECTDDVRAAWHHLAQFIAQKMTEGYNQAVEDKANENKAGDLHKTLSSVVKDQSGGQNESNGQICPEENGTICPGIKAEEVVLKCDRETA